MSVTDNEKQRIISKEEQTKQSFGKDDETDTEHKRPWWKKAGTFIWNSETKQFLGRTGKSWALILLFYILFYGLLAALFTIMLAIFFTTVSYTAPRLQGFDSLLKNHPGMGFRPKLRKTLVAFTTADSLTYSRAVDELDRFLLNYENQNESKYEDCDEGRSPSPDQLCRFNVTSLGPCTAATAYGYPEGRPCVLLKLNKIYGWTPQNLTDPTKLREYYNSTSLPLMYDQHIPLTCEGESAADKENMGKFNIYPADGLPFNFYPYLNQPGYLAPIAMIQFENPRPGTVILVWCKAWADNIYHDKADLAGSIRFQLLVDR